MNDRFSSTEVADFASNGFQVVRGMVASAECAQLRDIAERDLATARAPVEYESDTRYPGAPESRNAPGGLTVRRLLQAYARDERFRQWATSKPVVSRLQQLLGQDVALSQAHHNCIMTKDPRYSSITSWHRDIRYWSYQKPELVSVWLALGEERPDNGCLMLLPGSHVMDFSAGQLDEAQFLRTDVAANSELLRRRIYAELEPGDVLFFHCRLFHAAGHNRTAHTKFSAVFTYHAVDNRPLAGTRSAAVPDIPV